MFIFGLVKNGSKGRHSKTMRYSTSYPDTMIGCREQARESWTWFDCKQVSRPSKTSRPSKPSIRLQKRHCSKHPPPPRPPTLRHKNQVHTGIDRSLKLTAPPKSLRFKKHYNTLCEHETQHFISILPVHIYKMLPAEINFSQASPHPASDQRKSH